ncbi:stomatin-1-like isoform X1 [Argopecten irradians]|uniref:stomatin-1-like isoform X1 n=1 Tax=Argopecten irradians TaxID=31199 RepID=UPI00371BC2C6
MSSQNRVSPEPGAEDFGVRHGVGGESYLLETRSTNSSITDLRTQSRSQIDSIPEVEVPPAPQQAVYLAPGQDAFPQRRSNAWGENDSQKDTSRQGSALTISSNHSQVTTSRPDSGIVAEHHFGNSEKEAGNKGSDWLGEDTHEKEAHQHRNAWANDDHFSHHTDDDRLSHRTDDNKSGHIYSEGHQDSKGRGQDQGVTLAVANNSRKVPTPDNDSHIKVQEGNTQRPSARKHKEVEHQEERSTKNFRLPISEQSDDRIIGGIGEETGSLGCCGWILTILSILIVLLTLPFSVFFCLKVVQEFERAVIFRLGRLLSGGAKGPGIFFVLPCIESYTKVDLRTVSFDVPPQEILTKDSVTVSVDAVVYYRVSNPTVSVANVENAHHATRLLAQTTLRNILGTKNMSEILTERETISNAMQAVLDGATDRWGIKVERVEIKDVRLPIQLQRAMAAEAEAAREARAKVLAAEGEHRAARALKEAAEIISQSPAALQLRYLQTLNSISAEKNSTIIFPLPIDLIDSFMTRK